MKRFTVTLIILLVICAAFFYALSWPRGLGNERAVSGVLDLTNADFTGTRHNLDGEWEFFFGALYTSQDFASGTASSGETINVPGSWHNAGFPLYGYATYRLVLKTNEPSLMMLIPHLQSASILWINGEKLHEAGEITRESPGVHGSRTSFVNFTSIDEQVEIIVWVENHTLFVSGINNSIEVGRSSLVLQDAFARRILLAMFIGMLVTMFVYHLILFLHHRKDWVYLAFAMFCLLTAIQFFMEHNSLFSLFWNFGFGARAFFFIVAMLKTMALVIFTHLILKIPVSRIRLCIYAVLFGSSFFHTVFITGDTPFAFVTLVPLYMIFFSALRSKRLKENYFNYLYLIAIGVFCIAQPIQWFVIGNEWYIAVAAQNLFMVLTQFFVLSVSYAKAKDTEQKLAADNAALNRLSRVKTEFLEDIKHEVRNPLHIISMGTDYTNHCLDTDNQKEARTMLATIQNEAMRLGRMINGMVELATESGAANRQRIDFANLLKTCAETERLALEQKGNVLHMEIATGLPFVYAEVEQLTRVPINLFSNAIYSTQNGKITVKATSDKSYITVQIIDTGEGIALDILPNVFERGVSGKRSRGYGLAICKTIIEAHGGTIDIESVQNKGTTVTFTIPVYGGQSEVAKRE